MRDIISTLEDWLGKYPRVALATVISTWGSTPRPTGSHMAVNPEGEFVGSVSGGCVEGAVVEASLEVIRSGEPQLLEFGVADELAWNVGLACGGQISVWVVPLAAGEVFAHIDESLGAGDTVVLVMAVDGALRGQLAAVGGDRVTATHPAMVAPAREAAERALASREPVDLELEGTRIFAEPHFPPPRLVVIGAVHTAIPLVSLAKVMGYRTIVVDARAAFATRERFPDADELLVRWPDEALDQLRPDEGTAVVVLTHDPKFDEPALSAALRSRAGYIGAIGSRKTSGERLERLRALGFGDAELARIHGPIGLDLGGRTPEEVALAIMAEIVAVRHGRTGGMLGVRPAPPPRQQISV